MDNTTDYVGNIEYKNQSIEAIYHAEGRITFKRSDDGSGSMKPIPEYYLKDHLGNVRVVFSDLNANGYLEPFAFDPDWPILGDPQAYEPSELLQENHYYPFGMEMEGPWELSVSLPENAYLYNGKERDKEFGLNWDHYGARMYDSSIARFTGVDPIADNFAHVNVYNYAENEPIANIDLHGLQKLSIHVAGQLRNLDNPGKTSTFTAAILLDQGNNNSIQFGISIDGVAVGGRYSNEKGLEVGIDNSLGEFQREVVETMASGEKGGVSIPDVLTAGFIEDAASDVRSNKSSENSSLLNTTLELGAEILEGIANLTAEGIIDVIYNGKDGTVDIATNSDGEPYKREMTHKVSATTDNNMDVRVNGKTRFNGKAMLQYTQQECLQNCDN